MRLSGFAAADASQLAGVAAVSPDQVTSFIRILMNVDLFYDPPLRLKVLAYLSELAGTPLSRTLQAEAGNIAPERYHFPMALCALCHEEAELKDSHVLPAFVFRWLRQRSVTGHIRCTENINRRVQDGLKKPWLCGSCEQLLSRDEQAFATKVFGPYLREAHRVEYGPWLLRFCTSISWRVLKHAKGLNAEHSYTPAEDSAAVKAEAVWRDFLHGRRNGVGTFEQHLLPLDIIESTTVPDLADNINRYLTGYIDMDIAGTSKSMMTYAKLGRFVVFGMILKGRGPWEGTRVNAQHGYLTPRKYVLPHGLIGFFNDRARHVRASIDAMSAAQTAKVDAAFLGNIDKAIGSEQVKAMLADAELFGDEAIIRRS